MTEAIRAETAAMLQRDREHWSAVRDAAHGVALIEGAERSPFADNPNTCSHGYRFENGLCPTVGCGAGAGTVTTEIEVYRARTGELLADYDARLSAVVDADHEAALTEIAAAAQRRAEYDAYVCMTYDHGCGCLALNFDQWAQVVIADQLVTFLQHVADEARDAVRSKPYDDRRAFALGYLKVSVLNRSQAEAQAVVEGIDQGLNARVPL